MEIVKESVEKLWESISYTYKEQYSDTFLNKLLTYWCFFEEKEDEIQKISGLSLDTILYSKYYWCTRFRYMQNFCFSIPKNSNVLLIFIDLTRRFRHIEKNILPIDNFVAWFVYRDELFQYIPKMP